MINKVSIVAFLMVLGLFGCSDQSKKVQVTDISSKVLIDCNKKLTDALVERHFTPPVAASNYAYSNIALYTAIEPFYPNLESLNNQITDFDCDVTPEEGAIVDLNLVAFNTFNQVALKRVYSDTVISNYMASELAKYQKELDDDVFRNSVEYSDQVVKYIQSWAKKDMYMETRNYEEFTFGKTLEAWKPTSPDYMPAIEPFWGLIRPLVLDSSDQFMPKRPTEVDMTEGSLFFKELQEVYSAVDTISEEKKEIAQFWDCNPNISHHHGHVMFFLQKISPGGHWMHIATQMLRNENYNLEDGAAVMTTLGISLHDAFVACWEEKYNSNYVRPETVIKEFMDKEWDPILQTPAFPEYPSGHSVASAAAATILSSLVSDQYHFLDSTELEYGLPVREFESFRDASDEAAISRLYGGIHYMPAITEGVKLGNDVGDLVLSKIKLSKDEK